jgi:hypothetical protein
MTKRKNTSSAATAISPFLVKASLVHAFSRLFSARLMSSICVINPPECALPEADRQSRATYGRVEGYEMQ